MSDSNRLYLIRALVDGTEYEFVRPEYDARGFHPGIHSYLRVCPWCHKTWARITSEASRWHMVEGQSCVACGHEHRSILFDRYIPGSLLDEPPTNCQTIDWDIIMWLPEALRIREFEIHVAYLENQVYGRSIRNEGREHGESPKRSASLADDPEFARYFKSNTTWHLPERPGSPSIATYDNREPDAFNRIANALAANLAGGSVDAPRSECDGDGSDRDGQDVPGGEPG